MSTNTFTTTLELVVNGNACEREVTIRYEYSPAGGDGWHEPSYGESACVAMVLVEDGARTLDLRPLLSKECISALEADCVQHEADEREVRASEYAEWKRETEWEAL